MTEQKTIYIKEVLKTIIFGNGDWEGWPTLMLHSIWIGAVVGYALRLFGSNDTANVFLGALSGFFIFMGSIMALIMHFQFVESLKEVSESKVRWKP